MTSKVQELENRIQALEQRLESVEGHYQPANIGIKFNDEESRDKAQELLFQHQINFNIAPYPYLMVSTIGEKLLRQKEIQYKPTSEEEINQAWTTLPERKSEVRKRFFKKYGKQDPRES